MERSGKTYTRDEIRKQLSGHLCRCTGYENIVNAVEKAVDVMDGVVGEGAEKTA
jgi:carbon-monoxide dehydrogenase small subunit